MLRLTRVIVRFRSEPFGFSSIITYSFLFWSLLVGVKWWLALQWYEWNIDVEHAALFVPTILSSFAKLQKRLLVRHASLFLCLSIRKEQFRSLWTYFYESCI
jgi:hypothetical protein